MNFRRILSKSSSRSSLSSGKSLTQTEEISKLNSEIELLKQTIDSLKVSVESRDAAIGILAREKEKLYVELKSAQRTNRNLHQQLADERDYNSKEKEFLINEIRRHPKQSYCNVDAPSDIALIENQSKCSINSELKAKDEVIFNIGAKYLKIKSSKILLRKELEKLQMQNDKVLTEHKYYQSFGGIIALLTENRRHLNKLLDKLIKCSTVPPSSRKYLKLLQINGNLNYENTQLKINLQKEYIKNTVNNISHYSIKLEPSLLKLNGRNNSASFNNVHLMPYSNSTLENTCTGFRNYRSVSAFHGVQKSFSDSCIPIIRLAVGKDF